MTDWKDILNDDQNGLTQEKLNAYLEGRLSIEEQREVELLLSDEGIESDAVEGLKEMSVMDIQNMTEKVNYRLKHDLRKQSYRSRKVYADNKWGWFAILLIIVLVIIAYYILYI